MKRIDGYLRLDGCKKIVSDKDNNHYWIYIEGVEYYFKEVGNKYRELVGYQAAKYLGIDACYTDLAILDGKRGVISKSLRNNKSKLVSGDELLGEYLAHNFDVIRDMGFIGSEADNVIMSFSTNFKDRETKLVETLKVFFETSSYEYFLMFVSMFDKVFMNFDIILQNVEKQIGREIPDYEKEKIIVAFNKNCSKIQSVIDSYRKRKR